MKKKILIILSSVLSIFLLCLLYKLFVLPNNTSGRSKSIKQSQKIGAYIDTCRIIATDTIHNKDILPKIEKVWIKKPWKIVRNKWGIVTPMVIEDSPFNHILFKLHYATPSRYPIFSEANYYQRWGMKDSLTRRIGYSNQVFNMDYHYNKGDTATFTFYRLNEEKYWSPNIWNDDELIPVLRFKVLWE